MRDNPNSITIDDEGYSGENFVRFTGDTRKHAQAQLFAWEAYERGVDVHLLAEPTKLELLQKEYEKKKDQFKSQVQNSVLETYGGEEHLQAPPKTLLLAQTEDYVEYSRYGKVIKGREKEIVRSRYEEDVFINNHTTVWGSFWHGGCWGYKCCHSMIKNSYCLGEQGKETNAAAFAITETIPVQNDSSDSDSEEKRKRKKKKKKSKKEEDKTEKLKEALEAEDQSQKEAAEYLAMDERKRPYNSMFEVKKPTEEELEAYYLKRRRDEDPMNQFM